MRHGAEPHLRRHTAHALLLGLDQPGLNILVASQTTDHHLGIDTSSVLGRPVSSLMDPASVEQLDAVLREKPLRGASVFRLSVAGRAFDAHRSRSGALLLLELEPVRDVAAPPFDIMTPAERFRLSSTLTDLVDLVAREIKSGTGFDRVMVCRFDAAGAGEVIAEALEPGMGPYLNLHYPPSDIPIPARRLYLLNWIRAIPDVNARPAPLIPERNPLDGNPIDLSFVGSRSVSPVHLEYLRNMDTGIAATMSLSLLSGNRLWGLISCHHRTRHCLSPAVRAGCEFLARLISWQLPILEQSEQASMRIQSALVGVMMHDVVSSESTVSARLTKISAHARSRRRQRKCLGLRRRVDPAGPYPTPRGAPGARCVARDARDGGGLLHAPARRQLSRCTDTASGVLASSFAQAAGLSCGSVQRSSKP